MREMNPEKSLTSKDKDIQNKKKISSFLKATGEMIFSLTHQWIVRVIQQRAWCITKVHEVLTSNSGGH